MVQVLLRIKNWIHRPPDAETNGTEPPANPASTEQRQATNEWDYQTGAIKNAESNKLAIELSKQQAAARLAQTKAHTKRKIILAVIICGTLVFVTAIAGGTAVVVVVIALHHKIGKHWPTHVSFKEALTIFSSASVSVAAVGAMCYRITVAVCKWIDDDSEDE